MYEVNNKMMPAEEPEQSDLKQMFNIDYSHFMILSHFAVGSS